MKFCRSIDTLIYSFHQAYYALTYPADHPSHRHYLSYAYDQCRLYRNHCKRQHDGLWKHIILGELEKLDPWPWATGMWGLVPSHTAYVPSPNRLLMLVLSELNRSRLGCWRFDTGISDDEAFSIDGRVYKGMWKSAKLGGRDIGQYCEACRT